MRSLSIEKRGRECKICTPCPFSIASQPFASADAKSIQIVNSDVTVVALRLPRPFGRANRATSSKPARFIRHRRRFADFPDDPPTPAALSKNVIANRRARRCGNPYPPAPHVLSCGENGFPRRFAPRNDDFMDMHRTFISSVGRHPCVPPPIYAAPSTAGHIGPTLQAFHRG